MHVSKWLSHSTFTLTLDVYGDYIPVHDGGALNTLPERPAPETPTETASNLVNLLEADELGPERVGDRASKQCWRPVTDP